MSLPYETRNLGIPAFEVSAAFLERPDGATLRACLAARAGECGDFFVQARVRVDTGLISLLERGGFRYVESSLRPLAILDRNVALRDFVNDPASFLPARYGLADLGIVALDRSDRALCGAVRAIAGESFSDDRFHADHNCDNAVADRRFEYWVDDLMGDPLVAFDVMLLRRRAVAFMAHKSTDLILAGFSRQYAGAGLGDFLWLSVLRRLREAGHNRARTLISVRNIPVLNLHARLGFKFQEPRATFHYWSRSERE